METVHEGLFNAYTIFSVLLGVYALSIVIRNVPISGDFWGAMWTNTGLAAAILAVGLILTLQGRRPFGTDPEGGEELIYRSVYYLYMIYFIISLPGVFAIIRGNDNSRAAIFFAGVALFNAAAAWDAGQRVVITWK